MNGFGPFRLLSLMLKKSGNQNTISWLCIIKRRWSDRRPPLKKHIWHKSLLTSKKSFLENDEMMSVISIIRNFPLFTVPAKLSHLRGFFTAKQFLRDVRAQLSGITYDLVNNKNRNWKEKKKYLKKNWKYNLRILIWMCGLASTLISA